MSAAITIGGLVPWTWILVDSDDIAAGLPCTWVRSAVPGFRGRTGANVEEVLEVVPGEIVAVAYGPLGVDGSGYSGIETVDAVEHRNGSRRRFQMPFESDHLPGSSFFLASYRSAPRSGAWTLLLGYAQPKLCGQCRGTGFWTWRPPPEDVVQRTMPAHWKACATCNGEGFAE